MIKLVAFDWNGTLFADTNAVVGGVNEVVKLFGIKPITVRQYQENYDTPVSKLYENIGIELEDLMKRSKETQEAFHSYYENRADKLSTRSGTRKLLLWLRKNKTNSVIFSNHITHQIVKQLKRLAIDQYFEDVLANESIETVLKNRTKEEKLKKFVMGRRFKPNEVLVVGDHVEEIEIGKSMGATAVGITQGVVTRKRLKTAKPDYLINNLSELIGIVKKLNTPNS